MTSWCDRMSLRVAYQQMRLAWLRVPDTHFFFSTLPFGPSGCHVRITLLSS